MSGKKIGIILFVACVLLALGITACSHIKIQKKDKVNTSQSEQVSQIDESVADTEVSATSVSGDNSENTESSSEQGTEQLVLDKIVAENKLDYTGDLQDTIGVVSDKYCYLEGSQVLYCIQIDAIIGDVAQPVSYYCTYSTYESVSVGDKLTLSYKNTTQNTFALISVAKEEN